MKIANKITYSFLAIGIVLTVIASLSFYVVSLDNMKKEISNELEAVVESRKDHIETYLRLLKADVEQLSRSMVLEDFLKKSKDAPAKSRAFDVAMKRLKRTKEANPYLYEYFLLDTSGRVVASSEPSNIGVDKSEDLYFLAGQKSTYIKDAYYSPGLKKPLIGLSTPFRDSATGKLIGILVARVELRELYEIVTDRTGLGKTGEIYIVNKDGYMITPSRFLQDTFLKKKIDTQNYRKSLLHRTGGDTEKEPITIAPDYRGVMALGAHRYIPDMQWSVLGKVDTEEAFAPLGKIRLVFVSILILVPVSVFLLGTFISRLIISPIERLHKGAEVIGTGNLDYRVGTEAKDEIGQLSRAFDRMAEHLKTSTTSIDNLNSETAERKKTEEALHHAAEEWQLTFDSTSDLIFIQDSDFRIIKANKALMDALKKEPEDIIGKKCYEILHKSNKPWPGCPFAETKKDLKAHVAEVDDRTIGFPLLVSVSPMFDENGKLAGSVHIAKDITEIKKIREELERSNVELKKLDQLKSDFVSAVSHELRTPLSIAKEGVSLVLDKIPGDINEKQAKILVAAQDSMSRLARIIDDLLDISKIESGKIRLNMIEIDMADLVRNVVSTFEQRAKGKNIALETRLPEGKVALHADEDKMIQVLTNLIGNAMKFTEKGRIEVSLDDRGGEVECVVSDTGIGISKEDISRVFEKFQQFGRKASGGEKGTGLGLAIAKGLIDLHNGKIWIESEFGKGTTVTFTIPKNIKTI